MKLLFFNRENARSPFVNLNTKKCKACWKCLDECPNNVIGRVNLPWHKHALVLESEKCIGCFKCVKACSFGAFTRKEKQIER